MVYVFFVQPGDMMTFDNEISIMQSVGDLKDKIKQICGINLEQQVLLINGGEPLDATKNLCSYMAGTDTNPIYLFSTNYDISKIRILENLNFNDSELKNRLSECYRLPVSLETVKKRAQIAQDFFTIAKEQLEFCQGFVHDQHMQQQGWSAVIANLEDIVCEFRKRWDLFNKMYNDFIADRDTYNVFLQHFYKDKEKLQRIPVLGTLLENQKQPMEASKTSEINTSTSQEAESVRELTLYEWISSSDSRGSLDDLYEMCKSNLAKFEKEIMPSLERQINETLQCAEKQERKEIEGLGKRLYDLEELLRKIKKYVEHQSDMAQSFLQNQNRASHLKDLSILPDLCATHLKQLDYIKEHHKKLMEDRNRIVKAKFELSKSLCARICWVQNVEEKLWELDSFLVYFHEHLQRLRKHLEVFQQLHLAPVTYMNAVAEVVRRRSFSQLLLLWASDLACHQLTIYNDEVTRRKEFASQFDGHFLNALFPGMSDMPPSFATEAPSMFDAKLPKVTEEDVERLKRDVPDLAEYLALPDTSSAVIFFMGKSSITKDKDKVDDSKAVEERLIQAVSEVGLASNLDKNLLKATGSESCLVTAHGLPHLKDIDKGCESETDTEEFEKVGQSPLELHFEKDVIPQPSTHAPATVTPPAQFISKQDASTSMEDNLQISRSEHEKLKSLFVNMSHAARCVTEHFRTELNDLKSQFSNDSTTLQEYYSRLNRTWDSLLVETDNKHKALINELREKNEAQAKSFKEEIEVLQAQVQSLEEEKTRSDTKLAEAAEEARGVWEQLKRLEEETSRTTEDLSKKLVEKEEEKEKSLKDITELLKLGHKAEIDNIKSRFKLMTMERSPSCSSLEKEKSGDFTSLPSYNILLAQMTENFELDKEMAIEEEKQKWEKIMAARLKEMEAKFSEDRELLTQDVARKVAEEKDKQIDILREREKNLYLECIKYKTTIQQLAENEAEHHSVELIQQIHQLKRENEALLVELEKNKAERVADLTTSVALCEGKVDATTSPVQESQEPSRSEISVGKPGRLNINSCKVGDAVLVLWDVVHENFKILQESKYMYFLHSDCLDRLGLSVTEGRPNKYYCIGEVFDKEYCHTRKSENRYKVPKGTKFFRVKAKSLTPLILSSRDTSQSLYHPRPSTSHSHGMSQSQSSASAFEPLSEEASVSQSPPMTPARLESTLEEEKDVFSEEPEEILPQSVEKNFAEDSGIVENVEQATAAIEEQLMRDKNGEDDRFLACTEKFQEQRTYISTNWFEVMLRSMFSKSIQNQ